MAKASHAHRSARKARSAVVTPLRPSQSTSAEPVDPNTAPPLSVSESAGGGSGSTGRVMRGALALFSIQPLTWATTFLLVIYAPQFLGSAAMGQWAILIALPGLATTVLGLGVPTVLVRRVAANPEGVGVDGAVSMVVVVAASIVGCTLLTITIRSANLIDLPPFTLELALATVIVTSIGALFLSILNGQHRLGQFAWLSAASSVAASVGIIAVLVAGGGLVGMMLLTLIVSIVVTVSAWRTSKVSFDWSGVNVAALKTLVIAGLPLAGTSVVLRLRGDTEVMLLGMGLSVEVLGWWTAAERIAYIALFVPTLLMTPLMPALSGMATDLVAFRNTLRRSLDLTVVLTLGASCGVVAIAPAVPHAFGWGPDFVAAIPLIELISLITPIVSAGMILGTALIALGDERRWFVMSMVASSLHLVLTPAAIYIFNATSGSGAIGAAIAKLLVEVLMIAGALYLLPRGSVSRSSWVVLAKAIIASAVMIAAVRMVLTWDSWLALPAGIASGGLIYVVVLAALRILPPSEIAEVSGFIRATLRRTSG